MRTKNELTSHVKDILKTRNVINFKTFYLSDYGEMALDVIVSEILKKLGRKDMQQIVYTSGKELIINATKANLKRVIFQDLKINLSTSENYKTGMKIFKENLSEERVMTYKQKFIDMNFPVVTTFYFQNNVLNIKVKNNFTLLDIEEKSIRGKFQKANSFANLFDFYMEYGDDTEGAGLGLAMVGILLDNTGIDKHSFTLFSNKYNETAAKLELPLSDDYISKRQIFDHERKAKGLSAQEYRQQFATKVFKEISGDVDIESD